MADAEHDEFLMAVAGRLPPERAELCRLLHRFTQERLEAARLRREGLLTALSAGESQAAAIELHEFLRECWEALDGLAREVNVCMHEIFPNTGLYPPGQMTRQCTFYVVRKTLREHPVTAGHPLSRLLWDATRGRPAGEYDKLSFLYNLSLFMPVDLVGEGELPAAADLTDAARRVVKPSAVARDPAPEGTAAMLEWVEGLVKECYAHLRQALGGATR